MTTRITAVSAGGVGYLLKGSGCDREREQAPERGQKALGPEYYLSAAADGEPPGVWFGSGLDMVGMTAGEVVTTDDVRAVFGALVHPDTGERLGRRPSKFKTHEERLALALAKEPGASPERQQEIRDKVRYGPNQKPVAYYDFTFSPVKSVSVYYAALIADGDLEGAAAVASAHETAVNAAMTYVETYGLQTRTGYHGKTKSGESVGKHEDVKGLVGTAWRHSTNREGEPQLHTHFALLNRAVTVSDGKIRTLSGAAFRGIKEGIEATYKETLEHEIEANRPVVFAIRPDGKEREIAGFDLELTAEASTRAAQVTDRTRAEVAVFVEQHNRQPTPKERHDISRAASLETRRPKQHEAAPLEQYGQWTTGREDRLHAAVEAAHTKAADVAASGRRPDEVRDFTVHREEMLQAAVEAAQQKYSSWNTGNLHDAIHNELIRSRNAPYGQTKDLVDEVLRDAQKYGIVQLTRPNLVHVPDILLDREGQSMYRTRNTTRYATETHLEVEARIVARARQLSAPWIHDDDAALLQLRLADMKLGPDQIAAAVGIMTSGRAGDVLIGPAGAGKSRTVGALAEVWREQFGARVMGLATSQIATNVLAQDGMEALNTAQFLRRFQPDPRTGNVAEAVRPGDLFILDESGMSSTAEWDALTGIIAAGGGKWVATGDHEQLSSVEAGGMLRHIAAENGSFDLTEIHRFSHAWEKDASPRLRVGDPDVVAEYATRGRLRGGTIEEMEAGARRAWLADTLAGRESLLITRDNKQATKLSRELHLELVRLGIVESEVLTSLRDGNEVGVGDQIQARDNNYRVTFDDGTHAVNRETYIVDGVDEHGGLLVTKPSGARGVLPYGYVHEHVTLGYASTNNAAEGRTVDTGHALLDNRAARNDAYPALTRGVEENTAWIVTHRAADEHDPDRIQTFPAQVLHEILGHDEVERTATELHREGLAEARSLAVLGTEWDLIAGEAAHDRYSDTIVDRFGVEQADALVNEPGYLRLMRTVRLAEMAGHNPDRLLREAVALRPIGDAKSVTDVLRWRIQQHLDERTPEQQITPGDWTALSAPVPGPLGQYVHELAVNASDRQHELGRQAAVDAPAWATHALGGVPEQAEQREEWIRRAGIAAAYRELHAIPEESLSLGAAPSKEHEFHRALYDKAHVALGSPTDSLDYRTATDQQLRDMRQTWQREQAWAPPYVAQEMEHAYIAAADYRDSATLYELESAGLEAGTQEHDQAIQEIARARDFAAAYTTQAESLEEIHASRTRWSEATQPAREQADLATEELQRRNVPLTLIPEPGEQLAMFHIADPAEVGIAPERDPLDAAELDYTEATINQAAVEPEIDIEPPTIEREPGEPAVDQPEIADQQNGQVIEEPVVSHDRAAEIEAEPVDERDLVDENQTELFHVEPAIEDVVAARPYNARYDQAEVDRADETEPAVDQTRAARQSLAEAQRQARAAEQQQIAREAAAAQREAERVRNAEAQQVEADRRRITEADTEIAVEEPAREHSAHEQEIRQRDDEPVLELTQDPPRWYNPSDDDQ